MTTEPLVIYLDQNHWISLARAYHNHPAGTPYKTVLEKVQLAAEQRKAIFPLSGAHLIETRKTTDLQRRQRLAAVMAQISMGTTISPQYRMSQWEIAASVARFFGKTAPTIPNAIGYGIPFAFGLVSRLYDTKTGNAAPPSPKHANLINEIVSSPIVIEQFLMGSDETQNIPAVERYAQSSEAFIKRAEGFRLNVRAHGKSIHKRAYAGSLTLAMQSEITQILALYDLSFQDFLNLGQQKLMAFYESVPTLNVEIELIVERNENWDRKIDINDKMDITFLSVAIPYCDIVVTERFFRSSAQKRNLGGKYGTFITNNLNELLGSL